jgi:hypothetical protein
MKKISLITLILIFSLISIKSDAQVKEKNGFYFGLGTSISSYLGGDFGKTFAVRYSNYRDNDFYDNNYYYYPGPYRYNELHTNRETFFPLQVDMAFALDINKYTTVQLESAILWHLNGRVNRNYETGTIGDQDYIDRNDNASLISVPILASVKYYPLGKKRTAFYITGGYGVQYMQEGVERIRSVYDYSTYNYNNYSNLYEYQIADYKAREWIQGVKVGMGFTFRLTRNLLGDVELKVTNFFMTERNNDNVLSMYRTPNITNIGLSTRIFFAL